MVTPTTEKSVCEDRKTRIMNKFIQWSLDWIPDSMVFVLLLTLIVFLLSLGFTEHGVWQLVDDYAKGFWTLLTFSMQMSIMMVTGFVIADAPPVKKLIIKLINLPKSVPATIVMFALVCGVVSWIHWGMGLMLTIIMGKEIAIRKKGRGIHYAYIVAIAYTSMNIMANGISQAAPLLSATPGNFLENIMGIIPISQTSLSPFMMTLLLFFLVSLPLIYLGIKPKAENAVEISEENYKEFTHVTPKEIVENRRIRPAERLEKSRILTFLAAILILVWVANFIIVDGIGNINLNVINFAFFGFGLLLHDSPNSFINSVKDGASTIYGVVIQFPMYAGIFGIISYSGLAIVITNWFLSIATPGTYPWIIFIYTGIMDFFVPSAGSKFVIEAPYLIPAAQQLGVPVQMVINAYGSGAQWANLIQPFWALAYLAAFKIKFQDILPFTFLLWLFVGIVCSAYFLIFPFGW
ncbi:TIGR00366 family protein [Megasphaera paucivorans]|uniref:Short-chain fatty acids transporter n=1 Tax=Megasphaera paucivorans TaxID=349095 RepID=A0A1G9YNN7_9FIRM|nr:TIGR00366 family protein [Megasphaera paucivorans]SDN10191.1 short-chain fatty acids transporter [Megasphaera paucivorans]